MTNTREFVWGVDPQVGVVAFAFADVSNKDVEVETLVTDSEAREGQRFGWLDRQVRIYAKQVARVYPPACVWVEQPSGPFDNLQLKYAVGVIQAALYESLGCPVWTIPSSKWKQRSVGRGNATKPDVMGWVHRLDPDIASQHEADAFCIAWAGRSMLNTRKWDEAA